MIFQLLYDRIRAIKTPKWYKMLMAEIQDLIISIMLQVGKDYINQLQVKILEVSKENIPSQQKFNLVYNFGKELLPTIKESFLNLLIESLVNRLKIQKAI